MTDLRVGLFGTSWWADSMYLPAITAFDGADVVAVCGRDADRTRTFASAWSIPFATTDPVALLDQDLDAVIVASTNDSHHPLTMAALARRIPVLCEKPLAVTVTQAEEMVAAATTARVATMVPFTYRYMPTFQYLKSLIDDGYIGQPFHLNLRYFTGYGLDPDYSWRFDADLAGSGVLGDLGSHWLHIARWLFGEITEIGATTSCFVNRSDHPHGIDYERAEDSATIIARFANGAQGTLQTSAICWEGGPFNQTHHVDIHGSSGSLYSLTDWQRVQEVRGLTHGDSGPARILTIPDSIWAGVRRDSVHDTYRDVFRSNGAMIGDFLSAVATGATCDPDFEEGLRIQCLIELAKRSARLDGRLLPAG